MHDEPEVDQSKQGPRRIVDLKVDEVSSVDSPAIRREFLIVKRLDSERMGAFETEELMAEPEEIKKAELDEVESWVTKALEDSHFEFIDLKKAEHGGLPPDLMKALRLTVPWMRKMAAQAEGETRMAIIRTAAFLSKVMGGRYPSPKAKDAEKAGHPGEQPKPKTKALSLDDSQNGVALLELTETGELRITTKGRSFTPKRTAALADGTSKLLELLRDTDQEAFKKLVASITEKELPRDPKLTPGVAAVGTRKSDDGSPEGEAGMDKVMKALESLGTRLESIEKARSPSKSVDPDGGSDNSSSVKKSLWSGVL